MLCSSSCFAIFFKTLGCAVQAVAPRPRICDPRFVKVRQTLRAPWLIPVIHVLNSPRYEGFRTISTEFSAVVTLRSEQGVTGMASPSDSLNSESFRERVVESLKRENLGHGDPIAFLFYLSSIPALSASCFVGAKFDKAAFYFAVYCLTNKPAFLGRTVVILAHARAAFVGGNDRVPERTFGEPVKVAAKDGLEVHPITALK